MLNYLRTMLLPVIVLMMLVSVAGAKTYVSLNGEFYITYPDEWDQVDYNTVDMFLARSNADQTMFDYDAVFAPSTSMPFFIADYLILTVEKVGELTDKEIDSVLEEYSQTFQNGITYVPTDNFLADLRSDAPGYDRDNKVVTVLSDILQGQEAVKKNLIMTKFYEHGVATFYFYSTDSLFETSKETFEAIVSSFSTENIQDVIPREEVKVADIETDEEGNVKTKRSRTLLYLSIAVFILLVIVAVFVKVRSR